MGRVGIVTSTVFTAHYLAIRSTNPKAIAILLEAFDGIAGELNLQGSAEWARAAKIIIELATGQMELDAAKLHDQAVIRMQNQTRWRRSL